MLAVAGAAFAATTYSDFKPGVGETIYTASPLVSVTVADPVGIYSSSRQMKIDGRSVSPKWKSSMTGGGTFYYQTANLAPGTHTVYASVLNFQGVRSSYTWTFTIRVKPTIGPMSPPDGTTVTTTSPTVSAIIGVQGTPTYQMKIDGAVVPATYNAVTKSLSYKPSALANDRTHTASVTVTDSYGQSASVTWTFNIQVYPDMIASLGCVDCHPTYPAAHPMTNCDACHGWGSPVGGFYGPPDYHPAGEAEAFLANCLSCHGTSAYTTVPNHADLATTHSTASDMSGCSCHVRNLTIEHNRYVTDAGDPLDCASCHGTSAEQQVKDAMAAGVTQCTACHADLSHPAMHVSGVAGVIDAESGEACTSCHDESVQAEHAKTSSSSSAAGCGACHDTPRDSFALWDKSCSQGGCHVAGSASEMHGSTSSAHAPGTTACSGSGCHTLTDVSALHSAESTVAAGTTYTSCSICHRDDFALTKDCTTCHAERLAPHGYDAVMHTATDSASLGCSGAGCHDGTEAMPLHPTCATCHANPTKGDLTAEKTSFLCNGCHVTEGVDYHQNVAAAHVSQTDCYGTCHSAQIESTAHAPSCGSCHQSTATRVTGAISSQNTDCSACHRAGSSYVDATGQAYVLVGAEHDGIQPAIMDVTFNYTASPAAPVITWTTDRPATTYVDYTGPDWSYDGMQFNGYTYTAGSATLSTSHSVSFPAAAYSSSSGYYYCYRIRTVDAQGNVATSPMRIYHRNRSGNTNYVPGSNEPDYASLNTDLLKLSAIQQNGSRIAKVAQAGWESQSAVSALPTPGVPGTPVAQTTLDAGSTTSYAASWWRTKLATADAAFNWQLTRFQFEPTEFQSAQGFEISWSGYAENSANHPVVTYLWNFDNEEWDRFDSRDAGGGRSIRVVDTTDAEQSYCLRCHATPVSSAVSMPSDLTNMRVAWNTDYHGAGAGAGYGGTLKDPYVRGQAALACDTCHEPAAHGSSANPYKLKTTVNGSAVSVTTGTEAVSLCSACHAGTTNDYHAVCITCHQDPAAAGVNYTYHTTGQAPLDFTGRDCLECHKHGVTGYSPGCHGCHNETGVGNWTTF